MEDKCNWMPMCVYSGRIFGLGKGQLGGQGITILEIWSTMTTVFKTERNTSLNKHRE